MGMTEVPPLRQASDRMVGMPTPTPAQTQPQQQMSRSSVHEHQPALARAATLPATPRGLHLLVDKHETSPLPTKIQAVEQVWMGGTTLEQRQQAEMSSGADYTGAPVDECQVLHSGRLVNGPPLGHAQSSLMCDSVGNRVAGAMVSPPMPRHTPTLSSLSGCRIRPPQSEEWFDAKPSPAQDPLSDRHQPEAFLLTPRMGGGVQQWSLQSPQWDECSTPGTVSPAKAGTEATRPSLFARQAALGGTTSPRQGPVAQQSSPQRIPSSALAKWEGRQSSKASAGGGSVASFSQQRTAEIGVFAKSSSRPLPKTFTATEKGPERSNSAEKLLEQQVPLVFGRQNWPPRPPGCSSPGHSPVKSPQKIPASALAPWQGQGSSPKLLPFIQELTG